MKRASGHRWEAFARSVIDYYGGVCWICGHGGARQVDHVIAVTDRPDLTRAMSNCRPAHGAPGNPCPQCSAACGRKIHCNQLRGGYSIDRAKRKIGELAAEHAAAKPAPVRRPDPGRPWLPAPPSPSHRGRLFRGDRHQFHRYLAERSRTVRQAFLVSVLPVGEPAAVARRECLPDPLESLAGRACIAHDDIVADMGVQP